jgi:DNA-binding MarR family transcriptional regulator/GNAT superfamily N-acetyltransferase
MDILRELGPLAFASCLKRLSDRLLRDGSRLYADLDVDFQARWFPVLFLLRRESSMSVTSIASALGQTHPSVNQIAGQMSRHKLLVSSKDPADDRKRILSLSTKGKQIADRLTPVWEAIRDATQEVIDTAGGNALETIARIEAALDEQEMYTRICNRLRQGKIPAVAIVTYSRKWKNHFRALNEEWLTEYFSVEEDDMEILQHPEKYVRKRGGEIFFALEKGGPVGTVAMIPAGEGCFELAKMAVTKTHRGQGIGQKLTDTALGWARNKKAAGVILYTSPRLKSAVSLYEKVGFVEVPITSTESHKYQRCTIKMALDLHGESQTRDTKRGVA